VTNLVSDPGAKRLAGADGVPWGGENRSSARVLAKSDRAKTVPGPTARALSGRELMPILSLSLFGPPAGCRRKEGSARLPVGEGAPGHGRLGAGSGGAHLAERLTGPARATAARAGRQSPSAPMEIQPERGCHAAVTRLYPPLARKRDRDRNGGASRLLLSSVGFVSFRAPIDSVVIQVGSLGSPRIPFCLFARASAWSERLENEAVDLGVMLQ